MQDEQHYSQECRVCGSLFCNDCGVPCKCGEMTEQEAHPNYFCEHGVFGFEFCQGCETEYTALVFECQIAGHSFVDNGSFSNPDSGAECLACAYCGLEFTHILY